ncbi:MAG: prepilin-type N-terminal cleavage/methylation domain-containing protein [Proteobacteria bacterium]|nr:prepilin-type N-terminal cleavage/methylation domain-containing protein [Pseudomonadota bacterium]
MMQPMPRKDSLGFTLMELTVVLFIVSILLGGLLIPLSVQRDGEHILATEKYLAEIHDALLGFALANGRLPCPASASSSGRESFCTSASGACVATTPDITPAVLAHGVCSNPYDGFVPGVTLGLSTIDDQGYAFDAWQAGTTSRIRYAVTTANSSAFTQTASPSGMRGITIATLAPDLKVCMAGANVTNPGNPATATCAANTFLVADAVAVVYSLGKNGATGGTSTDESQNPNPNSAVAADPVFVKAVASANFDDLIIWMSRNTLYNRMIAAGQLP